MQRQKWFNRKFVFGLEELHSARINDFLIENE